MEKPVLVLGETAFSWGKKSVQEEEKEQEMKQDKECMAISRTMLTPFCVVLVRNFGLYITVEEGKK